MPACRIVLIRFLRLLAFTKQPAGLKLIIESNRAEKHRYLVNRFTIG